MPVITEQMLMEALELGTAKEWFEVFETHVEEGLKDTIDLSFNNVAFACMDRSDTLRDFISACIAAQWSAFSAGWEARALLDTNN